MLLRLQDTLLKITEYHSLEWAQRLEEIGGPGVGGTELACSPHFVQCADSEDEYVRMALEASIPQTWGEAAWSYVYGHYRACILLCATLLEIVLKYELHRRGQSISTTTLGPLIQQSQRLAILTDSTAQAAGSVNLRRNDVIHANIQMNRPESLLDHTGAEHEIEPIEDLSRNITSNGALTGDGEMILMSFSQSGPAYSIVHAFKRAAHDSLSDVRTILESIYSSPESRAIEGCA